MCSCAWVKDVRVRSSLLVLAKLRVYIYSHTSVRYTTRYIYLYVLQIHIRIHLGICASLMHIPTCVRARAYVCMWLGAYMSALTRTPCRCGSSLRRLAGAWRSESLQREHRRLEHRLRQGLVLCMRLFLVFVRITVW